MTKTLTERLKEHNTVGKIMSNVSYSFVIAGAAVYGNHLYATNNNQTPEPLESATYGFFSAYFMFSLGFPVIKYLGGKVWESFKRYKTG